MIASTARSPDRDGHPQGMTLGPLRFRAVLYARDARPVEGEAELVANVTEPLDEVLARRAIVRATET